ncbi:hypothetical protein [Lysobacter capsici]|uniref:hypothetical protein n=1 Tax=Lysobacter capsici TaxID=435897 RepID=UPI0012FD70B8|nr:hypothetical protein [Lysobacter capsici]
MKNSSFSRLRFVDIVLSRCNIKPVAASRVRPSFRIERHHRERSCPDESDRRFAPLPWRELHGHVLPLTARPRRAIALRLVFRCFLMSISNAISIFNAPTDAWRAPAPRDRSMCTRRVMP